MMINKKRFKLFLGILSIMVVLSIIYILLFCAYKGDSPGSLNYPEKDNVKVSDVISNARKLKGVFYDQLQGGLNNIGGKSGFLVCCDVPNIAYAKAGISLEKLLNDDYKSHP